jgi:hypothetical protein
MTKNYGFVFFVVEGRGFGLVMMCGVLEESLELRGNLN